MRRGSHPLWSSRTGRVFSQSDSQLQFESLEPRRVLAATVYLDFGEGFPAGLTISDAESQALGGPAVFGDSYALTTLDQDFTDDGYSAAEIAEFKTDIVTHLQYLFAPFDVTIQTMAATSPANMGNTLSNSATNDAYVYLGGALPSSVERDLGAAVVDSGNTQDNLAFVFPAEFDNQNKRQLARFYAAQVAKQAAHTFGAVSTDHPDTETDDRSATGNVMQMEGTDSNGDPIGFSPLFPNSTYNWGFTRATLPQTRINGISPGDFHTFDYLAATLGRNQDGREYVTTTGGSDGVFTIHLNGDDTVDVIVNGETIENLDTSNGLTAYIVGWGGGYLADAISISGQSANVVMNEFSLTVNDDIVVTLVDNASSFRTHLQTGAFNDTIEIRNNLLISTVDSGDGDDILNIETNIGVTDGGSGNDRFVVQNPASSIHLRGESGFDILDFSLMQRDTSVGIYDRNDQGFLFKFYSFNPYTGFGIDQTYSGFDQVIGPQDHGLNVNVGSVQFANENPLEGRPVTSMIDNGRLTLSIDGESIEMGEVASAWGNFVLLQSTSRPVSLRGDVVQLSSTVDRFSGNVEGITHDVSIGAEEQVIITNASASAKTIQFLRNPSTTPLIISGISPANISVNPLSDFSLSIYGSDSGSDTFELTTPTENHFEKLFRQGAPYFSVYLFGLGGNDYFEFGSGLSDHAGDLGQLGNGEVEVFGGPGDDYVYLNDELATGAIGYQINESGITDLTYPGESQFRLFNGVRYQGVETVRLTANELSNRFKVAPSMEAVIMIEGGDPGAGDGDSIGLYGSNISNRNHIVEAGQGNGTWYFGNGVSDPRLVLFRGVEKVTQSDRLAVGSQYGTAPLVSVFESSTGRFLFDIQPYESDYIGGVQVETADLNGDTIPDIVVAPGWGRFTEIKIYDGRDGSFLNSFFAYPSNLPNPSDNFTAGADLVIANVLGDEALEIVTSTLWGTADIRVFSQTASLEYELTLAYNPFDDVVRGVRIDTGNFFYDGRHEIVASAAPGNLAQVRIHSFESPVDYVHPVIGFTDYAPNYLGGFNLTVGDFNGDQVSDIAIAGIDTGSSIDPFSGVVRVLDGKSFPPNFEVRPIRFEPFQAFPRLPTRGISLKAMDFDVDGVVDRVFASQSKADNGVGGEIRIFDGGLTNEHIDSIFANQSMFDGGLELG